MMESRLSLRGVWRGAEKLRSGFALVGLQPIICRGTQCMEHRLKSLLGRKKTPSRLCTAVQLFGDRRFRFDLRGLLIETASGQVRSRPSSWWRFETELRRH